MQEPLSEQRKSALIEEITRAFDGVSRENGVSLSESWVIDDYGHYATEERAEARKQDKDTRWQDVPEKDIAYGCSCLSFLDEIGFRYYIPAYMVWYLRNIDNEDSDSISYDSNTFDAVIFHLDLNAYESSCEFYLSRFKMFTHEQSRAIAHFLLYAAEHEEACILEMEQCRQEMLINEGYSQEEIDTAYEEAQKFRREHNLPDNQAIRALEQYWAQFL